MGKATPKQPVLVSDISLWEIALLVERGRVRVNIPLREWLERAAAPPLVKRCGLSPAVVAEVVTFSPDFHRDPADRIIVATARVYGATLLTCDERIIASHIVPTLA